MMYRLGKFVTAPYRSRLVAEIFAAMRRRSVRTKIEELNRQHAAQMRAHEQAPDLREAVPQWTGDREWLTEVHAAMAQLGPREVCLEHAEYVSDGYIAVSAFAPRVGASVRVGDELYAGFAALRAADQAVRIEPRIYRVVCSNGAITPVRYQSDSVAAFDSIGSAVAHCLSRKPVEACVAIAQRAAATPVTSSAADRILVESQLAAIPLVERMRAEFRAQGDPSLWGVLNAITAAARGVADLKERYRIEECAWLLLLRQLDARAERSPMRRTTRLAAATLDAALD